MNGPMPTMSIMLMAVAWVSDKPRSSLEAASGICIVFCMQGIILSSPNGKRGLFMIRNLHTYPKRYTGIV